MSVWISLQSALRKSFLLQTYFFRNLIIELTNVKICKQSRQLTAQYSYLQNVFQKPSTVHLAVCVMYIIPENVSQLIYGLIMNVIKEKKKVHQFLNLYTVTRNLYDKLEYINKRREYRKLIKQKKVIHDTNIANRLKSSTTDTKLFWKKCMKDHI